MANDKAIEYNSILFKVNKLLSRMEKIGLNTEKFTNLLGKVEAKIKEVNEKNNESLLTDSMNLDALNVAYIKAISELNLLLLDMTKYEIYIKAASFCGKLRSFIADENPNQAQLEEIRIQLLGLLDGIKKSETLDYQIEGPLVEDIYSLTYEFIKLEIRENDTSEVLTKIATDEIDRNYIERAIINELEHLDLKDAKYEDLVNKQYELDSLGLDSSYVNQEFISLIVNSTTSYEINQKKLQELNRKLEEYYAKLKEIDNKLNIKTAEYNKVIEQKTIQKEFMGIVKNIIMTLTSIGVAVSLGFGAIKLAKGAATEEKYKVTTTTYSTISDVVTEEEYCSPNDIKVGKHLYKYAPYQKNMFGEFIRRVTKYDLTNLEPLTLEEYLNLNLSALGIDGNIKTEKKGDLSLKDLYEEAYYVLQVVELDEEDKVAEVSIGWLVVLDLFCLVIAFIIDYLIEDKVMDKRIFREDVQMWGFIDGVKNIIAHYQMLMISKENLKSKEKELRELNAEAHRLITENKDIVNKIVEYLKYADNKEQESRINDNLARTRKLEDIYRKNYW